MRNVEAPKIRCKLFGLLVTHELQGVVKPNLEGHSLHSCVLVLFLPAEEALLHDDPVYRAGCSNVKYRMIDENGSAFNVKTLGPHYLVGSQEVVDPVEHIRVLEYLDNNAGKVDQWT